MCSVFVSVSALQEGSHPCAAYACTLRGLDVFVLASLSAGGLALGTRTTNNSSYMAVALSYSCHVKACEFHEVNAAISHLKELRVAAGCRGSTTLGAANKAPP